MYGNVLQLCMAQRCVLKHIVIFAYYSRMHKVLSHELAAQAERPQGGDIRIAAFSRSVLSLMQNSDSSPVVTEMRLHDNSPLNTINVALRALQKQCMYRHDDYPNSFVKASRWTEAIHEIEASPEHFESFRQDMKRTVQSNVVERYKAIKLAALLMAPRIGEVPNILDVGCSRNHGLKKLRQNLPFMPVLVNSTESSSALVNALVSTAMKQKIAIGHSVGVDRITYGAGNDAVWARSCSFYPTELLNTKSVTEYDYLDAHDFCDIEFAVGDFTADGLVSKTKVSRFDLVTASTFMYQLNQSERNRARQNFKRALTPDGAVLYQDFAKVSGDGKGLEFSKKWSKPYSYRTMIEFGDGSDQIYELFKWDNGRCNALIPGKDIDFVLANHK